MSDTNEQLASDASFESVIDATQDLLNRMDEAPSDEDQLQLDMIHLLKLDKGPRGFFASLLTDARSIADDPPAYVLNALRQVPESTAELLTKNLAMSSAMVIHHHRQQDEAAAESSRQVQRRCVNLITQLQLQSIQQELTALALSIKDSGAYSAFLKRWNYDEEQRAEIGVLVQECLDAVTS